MTTRTVRVLTVPLAAALMALPALVPVAAHAGSVSPASGADLKPCRDGCPWVMSKGEVLVTDPRLGLRKLVLIRVTDGRAVFRVRGTQEPLELVGNNVSASSTCTASHCVNTGRIGLDIGYPGRINRLALTVEDIDGGKVHLTLRTLP